MKAIYEIGDQVEVTSHSQFGLTTANVVGGTVEMEKEKPVRCKIIRAWGDYETGRRYVGQMQTGHEIYFGEFNVTITPQK